MFSWVGSEKTTPDHYKITRPTAVGFCLFEDADFSAINDERS